MAEKKFIIETTDLDEIKAMAKAELEKAVNAETIPVQQEHFDNVDACIAEYKDVSKAQMLRTVLGDAKPMHKAVLMYSYAIIKLSQKKDTATKTTVYEIVDGVAPIDLVDIYTRDNTKTFGATKMWYHSAQKFNYYLTLRAAERLGKKLSKETMECMVMSDIAKSRDLGKDPCSNTQLLKTLTTVIQEMLGEEYKPNSHDVNYLIDVYVTDSKKSNNAVTAANHRTLVRYLKKVCYRILTKGTGYDVEQKEIKIK